VSGKLHTSTEDLDALKQQIESLNVEKQQLISLVSHDLRSPLNRAFALSELLLMDADSLTDFQKDYLERMRLVIADGLAMMRNMVDYRNLEFRSVDVMLEQINVVDFVNRVVRDFQSAAAKKQLILEVTHQNREAVVTTDKQCLDRVVGNLLSNACKFSKPDQKIGIRTSHDSSQVRIEIQDEIGGFSVEDQLTLFTKFKKYKAQPTGNESSTGLGLYIASAMATRIGATLECNTIDGVGSTFIITLPKNN
jgi:signal transduction histidine kinase